MAGHVGLWIDHHRAVIVALDGDKETVTQIESGVESHLRLAGGSRSKTPYGPEDVAAEDNREARRRNHLHAYYQKVIHALRNPDAIYVFGPAAAKVEFDKEVRKIKPLAPRLVATETTDKMTDHQIVAKVKDYFRTHR